MDKIKVAYLDYSYVFAGAERVLYTIIDNLDKKKFDPYLIFPFPREYQEQYKSLDCKIHFLSKKLTWWHGSEYWKKPLRGSDMIKRIIFGYRLAKYLKKENIKLLHVNLLRPDCYWWLKPCKDVGIKIIGHFRSQAIEWIPSAKVQQCCCLVLCVSNYSRSRFISKGIFVESRPLYDSIDINTLKSPLNKTEAKVKLGFPADCTLMTSVGQLSSHKGHDNAIKAFSIIAKKYPKAKLLIAGGGRPEDLNNLKNLVSELGIADRIHFTEKQVSNINEVYRASDLVLSLTKVGEAFGLVPFESSILGTPFLAPKFGAVTEFIHDMENGRLVDTNNVEEIASAIEWTLSHYDEAMVMNKKVIALVKEKLTPNVMVDNLQAVYEEIIVK